MRSAFKTGVQLLCLVVLFPFAALSGFGRLQLAYTFFAHACSLIPGVLGDYMRAAYYVMTLRQCSIDCQIGFGTYFSQSRAIVARGVGIGAYCVIGTANLAERCRLGSGVQVLSGQHQHERDGDGRLVPGRFDEVRIGADCWVGAAAIIMADVGDGATIQAGAVVTLPVPPGVTAAGNPARIIRPAAATIAR
ncbi:MAG TPA: acyltransferase [Bryobacteraceae bacterium]|nr:acyltransferase [Bryobacteraceae bacterium]